MSGPVSNALGVVLRIFFIEIFLLFEILVADSTQLFAELLTALSQDTFA
jgi:hypothetical protein